MTRYLSAKLEDTKSRKRSEHGVLISIYIFTLQMYSSIEGRIPGAHYKFRVRAQVKEKFDLRFSVSLTSYTLLANLVALELSLIKHMKNYEKHYEKWVYFLESYVS